MFSKIVLGIFFNFSLLLILTSPSEAQQAIYGRDHEIINIGDTSASSRTNDIEPGKNCPISSVSSYKVRIPAGPLWNNDEAQEVGPRIAAAHQGTFTGQWTTVVEDQMSVVEVELKTKNTGSHEFKTYVLAGPLWSNDEAQKLGPIIAASYGAEFTGQWRTIVEGVMSVIEIKYTF